MINLHISGEVSVRFGNDWVTIVSDQYVTPWKHTFVPHNHLSKIGPLELARWES